MLIRTLAVLAMMLPFSASAQSIRTVAGGGTEDGRPAKYVPLRDPSHVAMDRFGNVYVSAESRVRKISAATGTISTVAGNGTDGFSGDGGPATEAAIFGPTGIVITDTGDLIIADAGNKRIRKIDAKSGIITTVAGDGEFASRGDGGPATLASFEGVFDLAADSDGNLYAVDYFAQRVRRIDSMTGVVTTILGSGPLCSEPCYRGEGGPGNQAMIFRPNGVDVDRRGNVYVAIDGRVLRVDRSSGIVTTVAGGGSADFQEGRDATSIWLNQPSDVAIDGEGGILVSDLNRIFRVDPVSGGIKTVAGSPNGRWAPIGFAGDGGPATSAQFQFAEGLFSDRSGTLLVADSGNRRIRRIDVHRGTIDTIAGNGNVIVSDDHGPATAASLGTVWGVAIDARGNIVLACDTRIRRVDASTGRITTIAGTGGYSPVPEGDGAPATSVALALPAAVVIDSAGNIYYGDLQQKLVRRIDAVTGAIQTVAGRGEVAATGDGGPATAAGFSPDGIALDARGNLYIADSWNQQVRRVGLENGTITTVAGERSATGCSGPCPGSFRGDGGPATAAGLNHPRGVAVDTAGNLYIADTNNHRIRKVLAENQSIVTIAGGEYGGYWGDGGPATEAALWFPDDVEIDEQGNLYIAEPWSYRVRRVDATTGVISTVAGSGAAGYAGDGGPATAARFFNSRDIAIRDGRLVIADAQNYRVRAIDRCRFVDPPELLTPADGSSGVSQSPRLSWKPVDGAFRYDVLLDTVNPPTAIAAADIEGVAFSPANLHPSNTYYWQIVAKGDPFCLPIPGARSEVRRLTTSSTCEVPGEIR